ncbi:septation protein A [bacterium]|nr:septation protein A [bacterium]
MTKEKLIYALSHFGPAVGFLIGFHLGGLMAATLTVVIVTPIALLLHYSHYRKWPLLPAITCAFVLVFGGLTLAFNDPLFIKMRPTVVNLVFALTLAIGLAADRLWVKQALGHQFNLPDNAWKMLTWRMVGMFVMLACVNEIAWRHTPDNVWVNIKLFGLPTLIMLFFLAHLPFFQKYMIVPDNQPKS